MTGGFVALAGWYPDPADAGWLRYFDGTSWTQHRAPVQPPAPIPPGLAPWTPPWKGVQLGRPAAGPGALAEPWRRLVARLLDGVVLFPVYAACAVVAVLLVVPHIGPIFPKNSQDTTTPEPTPGFVWIWLTLVGVGVVVAAVALAYETVATTRYGRTLGKAWMGIRPLRTDGSPLRLGRAFGRAALFFLFNVVGWFGALDALWCLWDPIRQCLHDKGADAVVVNDTGPGTAVSGPLAQGTGSLMGPSAAPGSAWATGSAWAVGAPPGWGPVGGPAPAPTNGLAITSFVCAVAGLVLLGVPSVVGVVLGIVALRQIRSRAGAQRGAGLALAGVIVGTVVVLLYVAIQVLLTVLHHR